MSFDPALRHLIASLRRSPNWDRDLDLQLLQKLWPSLVGEVLASATTLSQYTVRELSSTFLI